jgi:NAD(P)-dependent dehydrogenase (short-subunit alcohol dehydrogenase family)
MATSKAIALFGAGPGLGTALATRFGREGARGVYAGTVNIGAMIERSAGLRAATAGGRELPSNLPFIDPDVIAEEIWLLVTKRDRVESNLPAMPANKQGGAQ